MTETKHKKVSVKKRCVAFRNEIPKMSQLY